MLPFIHIINTCCLLGAKHCFKQPKALSFSNFYSKAQTDSVYAVQATRTGRHWLTGMHTHACMVNFSSIFTEPREMELEALTLPTVTSVNKWQHRRGSPQWNGKPSVFDLILPISSALGPRSSPESSYSHPLFPPRCFYWDTIPP